MDITQNISRKSSKILLKGVKLTAEDVAKFGVDTCNATDVIHENSGGVESPPPPQAVAGYKARQWPPWISGFMIRAFQTGNSS